MNKFYVYALLPNRAAGGLATALKTRKSVIQLRDGVIINIYNSCQQVNKLTGYSQGNIRNVCEGVWKRAYGFEWRYG